MGGYSPAFSLPKDLLCGFPRAVQVFDIAFQGDAFQNVKGAKGSGGGSLEPHHDTVGILVMGDVDHILDDKGCAVVYILGIGKVEDNYFVVADVGAYGADQLIRRRNGEGAPEGDEADACRKSIYFFIALAIGVRTEETDVQQGSGYHPIQLQAFELTGAGHTGSNQTYCYCGDQVKENGEPEGDRHHQ